MKHAVVMMQSEFKHFVRSPFKIASFILFIGAAVYGLQNGYDLFQTQNAEIAVIQAENAQTIDKVVGWFDEGKTGPEDRPWVNITTPFWAIWNAPTIATKAPSSLMPFSIGQAEQFGYYKQVTNWSTTFDSDLAEEIANPERLTIGTLDFSFVVIYLLPVLFIVLLFNIGGLEKDLAFNQLIEVNHTSPKKWLLARFLFYWMVTLVVLIVLMLPYALITNVLNQQASLFTKLFLYITLYSLLWFAAFYFINLFGKGSAQQALKMVTLWLLFCVVIPGSIHQIASLKYPVSYMTDYIDVQREEAYNLSDLPLDSIRSNLLRLYPELIHTEYGKDTLIDEGIIATSSSGLINESMKNTALNIEGRNEHKNQFIQYFYWINPVSFFQNRINDIAANDYYAYKRFRDDIQLTIDKKINAILLGSWNKEVVDKGKYLEYIRAFAQDKTN